MDSLDLQQLRRLDGACILSVLGEIDESTVDIFEEGLEINCANARRLIVDLTACTVTAEGLAVLLDFHRRNNDRATVTLVARQPCLLTMLHAVGLTAKFETYSSVSAALSPPTGEALPWARTTAARVRRRRPLLREVRSGSSTRQPRAKT